MVKEFVFSKCGNVKLPNWVNTGRFRSWPGIKPLFPDFMLPVRPGLQQEAPGRVRDMPVIRFWPKILVYGNRGKKREENIRKVE